MLVSCWLRRPIVAAIVLGALPLLASADDGHGGPPKGKGAEPPWVRNKREAQDLAGGLPKDILKLQRLGKVKAPSIDEACRLALAAARARGEGYLDVQRRSHAGRRIHVPKDHATIQAAIDAAKPKDVVVVSAGTYYELLAMKKGVMLVSDDADEGRELVAVEGAKMKLPRRTLRTIVDGSKSKPSHHGLVDFPPGSGRSTVVDGFTFQNLPEQNHHRPGHAHGLNVRGASPIIAHCLIQDNGSTGIGNHVVYRDQKAPLAKRDFRAANILHRAEAVIYGNIVRRNLGRGIGCNHFSAPQILGNEVSHNDDAALGEGTGPGIGMKHGAHPLVLGNLVHDNPGGGIVCKQGAPQGAQPMKSTPHPAYERNVAWRNGKERPCLGAWGSGSRTKPVRIVGNWIFDAGSVGIGVRDGGWALIEHNLVVDSARPGISVFGTTVERLDGNRILRAGGSGIAILGGARVLRMQANVADEIQGPRFVLRDAHVEPSVKAPAPRPPR